MLLLACILLGISQISFAQDLEPFRLEEFLGNELKNHGWNGTWISDESFIYKCVKGDINELNVKTLKHRVILSAEILSKFNQSSITLSHDQKYVLIRHNEISVFRHSTLAQYTVYNTYTDTFYDIPRKIHIQYATWSPTSNSLVFVYNNNIFYVTVPESAFNPIEVTTSGIPGVVYHGVPDWVYEEEVLASGSALWFSPNGKRLAFATFNDTFVREYQYYMYGDASKNQYPDVVKLRYPKVGTANPLVALKLIDFEDPYREVKTLTGIIPKDIVSTDCILDSVMWVTDDEVTAVTQNRVQNIGAITRCNVVSGECNVELTLRENKGWLEISPPKYNKKGTHALLLLSQKERNNFYKHIVLYDIKEENTTRLTFGSRQVLSILHWDEENDLVYYSSTIEENSSHQHTHVVNVKTLEDECLTCQLKTPEGMCKVALSYPSKNNTYHTTVCSGPGPAHIIIKNIITQDSIVWEDNAELRNQLTLKKRPIIKDIIVPLKSGYEAKARLWLPPEFEEELNVKYPVIVDVYAGPGTNRISDSFTTGIVNYFTTNCKYIYVQIDGRGSARRGEKLMFEVYRRLGTVEVEDQIEVAKYLRYHYSFVDAEKIGIWGWSYGGFAAIWALIKDTEDVFKFGLAVAPVSNFILYDTIYTERYMGLATITDNLVGYNNTDATLHVENLRNKSFFLIHGNADDNVHYQQAMYLAKALERADIMFQQQSYPDEDHSLKGALPHLYHTIDRFFAEETSKNRQM